MRETEDLCLLPVESSRYSAAEHGLVYRIVWIITTLFSNAATEKDLHSVQCSCILSYSDTALLKCNILSFCMYCI